MSIYQRAPPAEASPPGWVAIHSWQADRDVECMVTAASSRSCYCHSSLVTPWAASGLWSLGLLVLLHA